MRRGGCRPAIRMPARQAAIASVSGATNFNRRRGGRHGGLMRRGSCAEFCELRHRSRLLCLSALIFTLRSRASESQGAPSLPWMNTSLTPEQRADLLIAQMTLEQKVQQLSNDMRPAQDPANRPPGCGFTSSGRHIQGIPALGIPTVRMTNGSTGIIGGDCKPNPVGTGVPSTSGRRGDVQSRAGPAAGRHPGQRSTASRTPGAARAHGEPGASSLRRAQLPDLQRGSVSGRSDGRRNHQGHPGTTASTRWRSTSPATNRKPRGESETP